MFFFHPRSRQFFFLSSFSIHILPRFSASPVIRRSPPYRTVNLPGLRVPLVQGFLMSAYSGLEICLYQLIAGYYCIGWQFKKKTANEAGGGKLWWIGCRGVSGLAVMAWGGGSRLPRHGWWLGGQWMGKAGRTASCVAMESARRRLLIGQVSPLLGDVLTGSVRAAYLRQACAWWVSGGEKGTAFTNM